MPGTVANSFADNFHQHPLATTPIELAVEDLFPRAEIEFSLRDGDDHFAAHDLSFQVCVGVVLASAVVAVLCRWFMRREFLQPDIVVVQQSVLRIVDIDTCRNVHGIQQARIVTSALASLPNFGAVAEYSRVP